MKRGCEKWECDIEVASNERVMVVHGVWSFKIPSTGTNMQVSLI